jgi:hypothetical protein
MQTNTNQKTNMSQSSRNPAWWKQEHQSGWDRMAEAFRRDWEQTKADFTGGKKGHDLNQDVGDTLGQAFGKKPIPPTAQPNPLDPDEVEKKVRQAAKEMDKQAERYEKEAEKSADRQDRQAVSGGTLLGGGNTGSGRMGITGDGHTGVGSGTGRSGRWANWDQAERPLRYGYGAASHYTDEWNEEFEGRLQREWTELYPEDDWNDVRDTVRQGWDRARPRM